MVPATILNPAEPGSILTICKYAFCILLTNHPSRALRYLMLFLFFAWFDGTIHGECFIISKGAKVSKVHPISMQSLIAQKCAFVQKISQRASAKTCFKVYAI